MSSINRKSFFPKSISTKEIISYYRFLLSEQVADSPHFYNSSSYPVSDRSIIVDVRTAEGIFALKHIEKAEKVYLFEPEEKWHKPLKATFRNWKEKIVLDTRFVTDQSIDENHTTINHCVDSVKSKRYVIKIDAEGFEQKIISGANIIITMMQ